VGMLVARPLHGTLPGILSSTANCPGLMNRPQGKSVFCSGKTSPSRETHLKNHHSESLRGKVIGGSGSRDAGSHNSNVPFEPTRPERHPHAGPGG
jgi:hypothetical protein